MPLLLLGLVGLSVVGLQRVWSANAELNRPRVPQRITAGPMPAGVHLPGPSLWPFVLPIGGLFVLLSLVFHPQGAPVNLILLGIGLAIAVAGVLGWYRDAGREWRRTELGGHAELAAPAAVPLIAAKEPPPGVHLPGPSPWPFFAPIALLFVFAGLVFGPLLIVGGLVMGVVAALGWYLDAGHEFRQVDAGHLPEPRTRDPRKAFPISVVKLYSGIAGRGHPDHHLAVAVQLPAGRRHGRAERRWRGPDAKCRAGAVCVFSGQLRPEGARWSWPASR